MIKEEWETVKIQREIPMYTWFEYYKERDGIIDDFETFQEIFTEILYSQPVVITSNGGGRQISLASATKSIHNYYDKKFG